MWPNNIISFVTLHWIPGSSCGTSVQMTSVKPFLFISVPPTLLAVSVSMAAQYVCNIYMCNAVVVTAVAASIPLF